MLVSRIELGRVISRYFCWCVHRSDQMRNSNTRNGSLIFYCRYAFPNEGQFRLALEGIYK